MADYPDIIQGAKPGQLIHRPILFPIATYVILGLNFLAFVVMIIIDASSLPNLRDIISRTLTGMSTDPELLLHLGASFGPYTRRGEYWRLVMPMLLHIGLLHLAQVTPVSAPKSALMLPCSSRLKFIVLLHSG